MQSAWEDSEWKEEDVKGQKTGGDICIKVSMKNGVPVGFRAQGAGDTVPYGKFDNGRMESVASGVDMTIYEEVPTSVSKNMSSDDLFKVRFVLGYIRRDRRERICHTELTLHAFSHCNTIDAGCSST
jgi:hypothetical protein